ncbi:hypothetical protein HPB51_016813 [Rhipicephalus microplus]|uniref:Uncharacterized protein n=1 Tax=Rhipicephalus microplus TaxID=6941 RepID=A0A9J6DHT7_RHIMP|nr:hypothetical protein HPB51_016813 [Rhipicephalus microplus]
MKNNAQGKDASRSKPVQTIPLPATGHIDSTPAAAPCTVAFAAETWSAELSVPGDLTTSAGPADFPAESPPVPALVEAHDTTHTMDPEPAVTLHAISFPCTPVPAAQNLVDSQRLLTSSSMYPTEVQALKQARLNVNDAVTMSGNSEGRTPGSPQVEHTVHAPTDAQRTVSNLSASYSAEQVAAAAGNVPQQAMVPARVELHCACDVEILAIFADIVVYRGADSADASVTRTLSALERTRVLRHLLR